MSSTNINLDLTNSPIISQSCTDLAILDTHVQFNISLLTKIVDERTKFQKALGCTDREITAFAKHLTAAKTALEAYAKANPNNITFDSAFQRGEDNQLILNDHHIKTFTQQMAAVEQVFTSYSDSTDKDKREFFKDCTKAITYKAQTFYSGHIMAIISDQKQPFVKNTITNKVPNHLKHRINIQKTQEGFIKELRVENFYTKDTISFTPLPSMFDMQGNPIFTPANLYFMAETTFHNTENTQHVYHVTGDVPDIIIHRLTTRFRATDGTNVIVNVRILIAPEEATKRPDYTEILKAVKTQSEPFSLNFNQTKGKRTSQLFEPTKRSVGQLFS